MMSAFSAPTILTLKKRRYFLEGTASPLKFTAKPFMVQAFPIDHTLNTSHYHVGFTATKKLGNAVMRNRAKRRMRAVVHDVFMQQPDKRLAYILIGRYGIYDASFQELNETLQQAMGWLKSRYEKSMLVID
jgi:ribonuclease P protein component